MFLDLFDSEFASGRDFSETFGALSFAHLGSECGATDFSFGGFHARFLAATNECLFAALSVCGDFALNERFASASTFCQNFFQVASLFLEVAQTRFDDSFDAFFVGLSVFFFANDTSDFLCVLSDSVFVHSSSFFPSSVFICAVGSHGFFASMGIALSEAFLVCQVFAVVWDTSQLSSVFAFASCFSFAFLCCANSCSDFFACIFDNILANVMFFFEPTFLSTLDNDSLSASL